jgi:hypothetical protein
MTYIPHRHGQRSVYRFVGIIVKVLDQHRRQGIASVSFNPLDMNISVETAIARLRDAVYSLSSGLTTHPSVDVTQLKEVWPHYKVTSDGVNVQVVSREAKQDEPVPIHTGTGTELAVLRSEDPRFVETLSAFAVLLGQRFLQGEVQISGFLSDTLQHRLQSENDVVFIQDGPNSYHMV